jgi:hypothetical protein
MYFYNTNMTNGGILMKPKDEKLGGRGERKNLSFKTDE